MQCYSFLITKPLSKSLCNVIPSYYLLTHGFARAEKYTDAARFREQVSASARAKSRVLACGLNCLSIWGGNCATESRESRDGKISTEGGKERILASASCFNPLTPRRTQVSSFHRKFQLYLKKGSFKKFPMSVAPMSR